ncbi:MAG: hypothetical protein COB23_08750 [Methylophaga sp.]|nr:MAG: hypothetical protein COB23_08750 [Methylophaga sp.]
MVTLKNILRTNAASCIAFGLIFLFIPSTVAEFLSTQKLASNTVILILGIGLIFNGLHLVWASLKPNPSKLLIIYFSTGDFLWVLATVLLIIFGIWITTPTGIIISLLISAVVGLLGVLQVIKRNEMGDY